MGYRSYFNLTAEPWKSDRPFDDEFIAIVDDLRAQNDSAAYALNADGSCADEAGWYDANEELQEFSKKYPEVLFCLDREGEESSDIERTWFLDGRVQQAFAKIVYDEFDEEKLV